MNTPSSDDVCIELPFRPETYDVEAQRFFEAEPAWRRWFTTPKFAPPARFSFFPGNHFDC